jgi:hypothetical protein
MPEVEPVTSAVLPFRNPMVLSFQISSNPPIIGRRRVRLEMSMPEHDP